MNLQGLPLADLTRSLAVGIDYMARIDISCLGLLVLKVTAKLSVIGA
jgi:hypothetical protein